MNADDSADVEQFRELVRLVHERTLSIQQVYLSLRDNGLLPRVAVHRYMCRRGCQIATVFRVLDLVLCAVRDYKLSPGMNQAFSVEAARRKNTLDGRRHWPAHVYDVLELERFSTGDQGAGMTFACRHWHGTVLARDVLATVEGVRPGLPGKPTRL